MPTVVIGVTLPWTCVLERTPSVTTVHIHLPHRAVHDWQYRVSPSLHHFAYRILGDLLNGWCTPTIEAVMDRYDVKRHTARVALKSLEKFRLLHRWRRSLGRGRFLHFAIVTDDADALIDGSPFLAATKATMERAELQRTWQTSDVWLPDGPEVPEPVDNPVGNVGDADVDNSADADAATLLSDFSCVENPQIPKDKNSRVKDLFYGPDRLIDKVAVRLGRTRHLAPYMPTAYRIADTTHFGALERFQHAKLIAEALDTGRRAPDLRAFLATGLGDARDRKAVVRYRLGRLRDVLHDEKRNDQEADTCAN